MPPRTKGKTRKSDLRRDNIKRHIALYSSAKSAALLTIEDIARRLDMPADQVKESVARLIDAGLLDAGLLKESQVRKDT